MPKSKETSRVEHDSPATRACWQQQTCLAATQWLLILAVFYLYVLLRVEPHLLYHLDPAIFPLTTDFVKPFLERPGGIVAYLSAFLSVTLAINWLGSAVLTLLASLIMLATYQLLASIPGSNAKWLPVVPALLLLLLLDQYVHIVELCVGLVVVLWTARAYFLLGSQEKAVRLLAFVALSILAYYLAAGLYVVFACLCGVYELGTKKQFSLGMLALLCAALGPLAGARWFDLGFYEACGGLVSVPTHWLGMPNSLTLVYAIRIALLLFFPISFGILAWWYRAAPPATERAGQNDGGAIPNAPSSTRRWKGLRWAAPILVFSAALAAADMVLFDVSTKCLLHMVCCAEDRRWEDVLDWSERIPRSDPVIQDLRVMFQVNRALYFTGRLPDQMFAYPQVLNSPSLALVRESRTVMAQATPRQCSEIFFQLGRINEAEHMASEALEIHGDWPCLLERLVQINVLKGRPAAAKRFLTLTEYSLLHRNWARQTIRQIDEDPSLANDPVIASRRKLMVTHDSTDTAASLEPMLLELLEANPQNKMAFEYLMAHYLLTRQLDKAISNLHRLDDFDYQRIPRLYEEALVLKLDTEGKQEMRFGKWPISQETWQRLDAFGRSLQPFPQDRVNEAYKALHPNFGQSYFFFFVFGANNRPSG